MSSATRQSTLEEAQRVLRRWLCGADFVGFSFATSFALLLERYADEPARGPSAMELRLEGDWWFGEKSEWEREVQRLVPAGMADPAEPLQAFRLASLRWRDGARVANIVLTSDVLRIEMENAEVIAVACAADNGFAWTVVERGGQEHDARWSAACEGGLIYLREPIPESDPGMASKS